MRKRKFAEEQIIGFLTQAEAGIAVVEICRNGRFSDATFGQRVQRNGWPDPLQSSVPSRRAPATAAMQDSLDFLERALAAIRRG